MYMLDALTLIVFILCFIAINFYYLHPEEEDRCEFAVYATVVYGLLRFCGAL